jgi:uncharacterized membrane protein (DUF4010 family)
MVGVEEPAMEELEPFVSLGVALAVGLIIGFEREQSAPSDREARRAFVGGARTYPMVALIGALSMLLARQAGAALVWLAFVGTFVFLVVAYADVVRRDGDRGLTSEAAFIVTFLLGALATSSGVIEPVGKRSMVLLAVAVLATVILSIKPRMHALAERVSKDDVFATLKFLIVAIVVLPLLPDQTYGPLGVLNPHKIGLMVALIAGIDFVGYVAVRALGAGRGLGLTGLVGGLASSTAVTLSMSGRARESAQLHPSCALAVVTASTVMFPRVLLEVAVVHRPLLASLWIPLFAMTLAGLVAVGFFYRRAQGAKAKTERLEIQNPFELSSALKWGLVFVAVLMVAKLATTYLGRGGTYLAGLLAGTTDVDAITLSMANLAKSNEIEAAVAVTTIIIGTASNTIVKGVMATTIGGWHFGRMVLGAFAAMLAAGALGLVWVWMR